MERIAVKRIVHAIHAVHDLAAAREKYLDLLGGVIFAESVFAPEDRAMALLYVTDFMIEPMEPLDPARVEMSLARYLKRHGERLQSFEIAVDDGHAANARLKQAGYGMGADYGNFFFVRGQATGGVLLEVCDTPMPNDPYDRGNWDPRSITGHRCGVIGLDHIACVIAEIDTALALFTGHFDGELLSDEQIRTPQPARRALVRLGGRNVAFLQPDNADEGPFGRFLAVRSSGLYALVWRVANEAESETFFTQKGVRITSENCVSDGFAIDPRDFFGARHEFRA
jgi:catechol 2,3-dioxygenase-like lactoylglutathione lyase family enzyme